MSACLSLCPSVGKEELFSHCMYYHENWYLRIFENMSRKSKFHNTPTTIAVLYTKTTLCIFMIISRSSVLRLRNISAARCRETQNTHFMSTGLSRKSCRLWDNVEKYDKARQTTGGNSIQPIHIACCTDTHSEYVIIIAFPQQQRIQESPTIFRYKYIACPYFVHIRALMSLFYL